MSDPITRLVELAVYAPIGVAAVVRERLPDYVDEGRARVEQRLILARFIGKMVVTQGRREIERRLEAQTADGPTGARRRIEPRERAAEPYATEFAARAPGPDRGAPDVPDGPPEHAAGPTVGVDVGAPRDPARSAGEPVPIAAELPIAEYESLAAAQVVARLTDLDDEALAQVQAFERAHRNRRTVLNRIDQLRCPT